MISGEPPPMYVSTLGTGSHLVYASTPPYMYVHVGTTPRDMYLKKTTEPRYIPGERSITINTADISHECQ